MPPAVRPLDMPQAGHMRVTCSPEGCGLKEHGRVERKGVEQAVGGRSGDRKGECVQPEESTVVLTSGYCTTRRSSAAHLSVARDSSRCPPLSVAIACTRALPPSRSPTRRTSFPPRHGTCWVRWPRRASAWWPRRAESDEDTAMLKVRWGRAPAGLAAGEGGAALKTGGWSEGALVSSPNWVIERCLKAPSAMCISYCASRVSCSRLRVRSRSVPGRPTTLRVDE